jgi:DNA polymerase I-like protein with 3'-5' exonuclease and polymerase domains
MTAMPYTVPPKGTKVPEAKTLMADIETTAIKKDSGGRMLYPETTHLITALDYERDVAYAFSSEAGNLEEGIDLIKRSNLVVFHNGIGFDEPTLYQNFGLVARDEKHIVDSMVLCRLFYSNIKELMDFDLHKRWVLGGKQPHGFNGQLIGSHSLKAWGLRLSTSSLKGDYMEDMKAHTDDPWAEWNIQMEEYAIQDVVVLRDLWKEKLQYFYTSKDNAEAIAIEHYMARLMETLKQSGIKLDVAHANALCDQLEVLAVKLHADIMVDFPPRFEPVKWVFEPIPEGPIGLDEVARKQYLHHKKNGMSEQSRAICAEIERRYGTQVYPTMAKLYPKNLLYRPEHDLPDGYSREFFGEVFTPKVSRDVKDTKTKEILYRAEKDCPFVKCHWSEFNPNSRPQIIRRLLELGWIPEEFTETDNPETSEVELTKIAEQFPQAKNLTEYMLIMKRLGQIKTGDKAWLKLVSDEGFVHPTIRPTSTITFRATHSDPNISQVPSVKMTDVLDANGKKVLDSKGKVEQTPLLDRAGKWGYECRQCFTVPEGFVMVGSDLAGIEMRAWAHYLKKYDGGKFIDVVLNRDVHEENRVILGFQDRRKAKEWLYACMYGAGDEKLGFIIDPLASVQEQKRLGAASRKKFMDGLDGYAELDAWLMDGLSRGYVLGLDGRRVPIRKRHAALNTLLQSAGAIISKYWIWYVMDILEREHGLKYGYDKDFTLMIYSHDEIQIACKTQNADIVKDACERGARLSGERLKFELLVEVGTVDGAHWGDTH